MLSLLTCLLYIAVYFGLIDHNSPYYHASAEDILQESFRAVKEQDQQIAAEVTATTTIEHDQQIPSKNEEIEQTVAQFQPYKSAEPQTCVFPGLSLPKEFVIYAAGGYSGRKLDYKIDQSGHQVSQFDITVNETENPVVLMLGAYEPTIWNVSWTEGSKIIGIFASGYHKQVVVGVNKNIPILISSSDNKGGCGYFYLGDDNNDKIKELSSRLFGKSIDKIFYEGDAGKVILRKPLIPKTRVLATRNTSVESYSDKSATKAGRQGLEDAMANGQIRMANEQDKLAWEKHSGMDGPKLNYGRNVYVVVKPFTIPDGLYGAHSVVFIVAKGVPYPRGNPGHSDIYDFNSKSCVGHSCYRH